MSVSESDFSTVFICGCPRSGTTALWRILSFHELIAIGVERYVLRGMGDFSLSNELFEEERFFRIQNGDTFYSNLEAFNPYYINLRERFKRTLLRGDKIPKLYVNFPRLRERIPNAKVIFIVRNPFDVALSYNNRARNPNDKWKDERDYTVAISDWNQSLRTTLRAIQSGFDILCVEYEHLFSPGGSLSSIFKYLGLRITEEVKNRYHTLVARSTRLEQERKDGLTGKEKQFVLLNSAIREYKEILAMCR